MKIEGGARLILLLVASFLFHLSPADRFCSAGGVVSSDPSAVGSNYYYINHKYHDEYYGGSDDGVGSNSTASTSPYRVNDEFSTWEAEATHRILASNGPYSAFTGAAGKRNLPVCNGGITGNCIDPKQIISSKRMCKPYDPCARHRLT